ncbi:glycoside hydrolase family 3 N-terminal domain-containing protein [Leucobacter aridicollis]|uniref:glycoside hydrolase family 3 N-terminal domain-containing protein n=1 Tax=Leucobacter aridicollis TaxID=283878 RepID=UPI0021051755|nr:glycoside hydrolase family 3 N-terminal domain-containing protein [Leucobacter aridicollis]UTX52726.1 glycoside hydrolase family 3 protein [Leucobacter aridicollis]
MRLSPHDLRARADARAREVGVQLRPRPVSPPVPARRTLRWAAVGALSVALSAGLIGCAPEPAAPAPSTPTTAAPPPPPTPEELREAEAAQWVAAASTRELAGSVIMASIPTTDPAQLRELMTSSGIGGFIIMGANVPGSPEELAALTAGLTVDATIPPLVAIDEEGGLVTRLPWDTLPGADELRSEQQQATTDAFRGRANLLRSAGVNVNFGVVADATADVASFIYPRSLGDTGKDAATRVTAAVAGERGLVASTLKHFPGHGATPADSHQAIPETALTLTEWRADTAVPFASGINAGAELLMFGHLAYTDVSPKPASLAPEWYALARTELGFTGVAVTDDLGMLRASGIPEYQDPVATTVAAIAAGADLALTVIGMDAPGVAALVDGVTAAADTGTLPEERLREAATRVTQLRLELAAAE